MSQAKRKPAEPVVDLNECPKVYSNEELYLASAGHWLGYVIQKSSFDLMAFHNLLYDIKPDILVETGTWHGGSALFYATIMDAINHGQIITIDNWAWRCRPQHQRIGYVAGSSVDKKIIDTVKSYTCQVPRVIVFLDSDHNGDHVYKELDAYAPMVTVGSYCIVEDTNINGHPIRPNWGPHGGPWEAVHDWLPKHPEFRIDHNPQPIYTNNPDGWLLRVK